MESSGDELETHSQLVDVIFFVMEGTGTLEIEDKQILMTADSYIQVEKGTLRKGNNTGLSDLKILDIKELA